MITKLTSVGVIQTEEDQEQLPLYTLLVNNPTSLHTAMNKGSLHRPVRARALNFLYGSCSASHSSWAEHTAASPVIVQPLHSKRNPKC